MARRRKIDASRVIEAVKSGRISKDVMDEFGLGRESSTPGKRKKAIEPAGYGEHGRITVSKRGSLVLPRSLMEKMGFEIGTAFEAKKTRSGIILKPVE